MKLTKYLAAAAAVCVAGGLAWGAGIFQTYPIIGGSAYCGSANISGTAQGGITGQGALVPAAGIITGTTICGQTIPAGPATFSGTETFPVDLYAQGTGVTGGGPATAVVPVMSVGGGNITVLTTTGTTASVAAANSTNHLVYAGAGAATWTTFALPASPLNNQVFCLSDAGTGILTLGAVTSGSNSVVGVTPTSIPVATAVGTAGTVTLSENCWMFQASNTSWYRIL